MSTDVFSDADHASKAADRRSVSGGLVMCGGACVSWFFSTQKYATLSTTKAEYAALFLKQVWRVMLPGVSMPCIPVFEGN